jgi:hypothetical protein
MGIPAGKAASHEANHSPQSSAEVKNAWGYTSTSQYVFVAWRLKSQGSSKCDSLVNKVTGYGF